MQPPSGKGLPMQTASTIQKAELFGPLDTSHLVIEDDTPVDNIFTEKQERLLTAPLYASWSGPPCEDGQAPRKFEVLANVGLFNSRHEEAIVPDVMLSLDVQIREDLTQRENRTYFIWEFGKGPEVVIEIVSNREGGELSDKMKRYRKMRIPYYVVYDPLHQLGATTLRSFELRGELYIALERHYFEPVGLGVVEWTGAHEKHVATWLRWCTKDGVLIPTGEERAEAADKRAEAADKRAEDADKRAELLAARLRALGIDPNAI